MQMKIPFKYRRVQKGNSFAATHLGIAYKLAAKARRKFPQHVEFDDIVGYAMIGLCEAASRFDVGRGLKFSTYAYPRVWGAILDGVKRMHRNDQKTEQLGDYVYELPDSAIEELLDMEPLKAAVDTLPKFQRNAIMNYSLSAAMEPHRQQLRSEALTNLRVILAA